MHGDRPPNPHEDRIDVEHRAAVGEARRAARARAAALGFGATEVEEIALVATELASNLVKHAGVGVLRIYDLEEAPGGIGLESTDLGPGIDHPEDSLADGISTSASLGYGLGTVNRLMDDLEITSAPEVELGTRVVCHRRVRSEAPARELLPLSFGVVQRGRPGQAVSGDTYLIRRWGEQALVAVIDGLGHGQWAARASQAARDYLERHYDAPLSALFTGSTRACRGTRGVVMALARFDLVAGTLEYGSVGNIEGRLWNRGERRGLLAQRGVVGAARGAAVIRTHDWTPDSILVLHSDGLRSHWSWDEFLPLVELPAEKGARILFGRLATGRDDAVVMVVKGGTA